MWSRDSSVGIALDYGLDDRGSRVRFLAKCPEWLWGPPSLLSDRYQVVRRPGHEADHSIPSSAVVECVEL
jgi:hypothetical protein